jgi:hypothetical protein
MRKTIALIMLVISVVVLSAGFVLSRSVRAMSIKIHKKDLPEHGLTIIGPSDPSFDTLLSAQLKGEPNEVIDRLKPFSFFVENKSKQTVVAYAVQWCFTKQDGSNECSIKSLVNPRALMEGDNLSEEMLEQSGRIRPNSTSFFSLISPDGSGLFRVKARPEEVEQLKQGVEPDRATLLQRYSDELSRYSDITFSIDGAFFDDGTFVGPDTTGFFDKTKAEIGAKYDLLNEIARGLSRGKSKDDMFNELADMSNQPTVRLNSKSSAADYYNFHKKHLAEEISRSRSAVGDDKALARALSSLKKPWRTLKKKD